MEVSNWVFINTPIRCHRCRQEFKFHKNFTMKNIDKSSSVILYHKQHAVDYFSCYRLRPDEIPAIGDDMMDN